MVELIDALVEHNQLEGARVLSVTFSVTADLDACFPAAHARRRPGWEHVALLDCQQMAVAGDLPRCIRLLAHAWMEPPARRCIPTCGRRHGCGPTAPWGHSEPAGDPSCIRSQLPPAPPTTAAARPAGTLPRIEAEPTPTRSHAT